MMSTTTRLLATAGAALVALTAAAATAEACTLRKIAGDWQLQVIETAGEVGVLGSMFTTHSTCTMTISRQAPGVADVALDCKTGLAPADWMAGPFHLDGYQEGDGRVERFPEHELQRTGRCEWVLTDLNGIDDDYPLRFSPDGRQVLGRGGHNDYRGTVMTSVVGMRLR